MEPKPDKKVEPLKFQREKHIAYLNAHLKGFHKSYIDFTQNHLSGIFFIVSSLSILDALDEMPCSKKELIELIYKFQIPVLKDDKTHAHAYGFRGGLHLPWTPETEKSLYPNDMGHIANTYCALAVLKICGDDLSRVNKKEIAESLRYYQNPETGCFQCIPCEIGNTEEDVRFIYCACNICTLLNDWSGFDKEKAIEYITKCQTYTGGFGWTPTAEAHSGLTFTIIASLAMMNALDRIPNRSALVEYLISRLNEGWNGRIGKIYDACYAFWNLGSLVALGIFDTSPIKKGFNVKEFVNEKQSEQFLFQCQRAMGGFSKHTFSKMPDPIHTLYSLTALSFFKGNGLREANCFIVIPKIHLE